MKKIQGCEVSDQQVRSVLPAPDLQRLSLHVHPGLFEPAVEEVADGVVAVDDAEQTVICPFANYGVVAKFADFGAALRTLCTLNFRREDGESEP